MIEDLREENPVLREQRGGGRRRFTDAQHRRLAAKAKKTTRKTLLRMDPIVTPDTLLRWYRNLVARKFDGSRVRRAGRPRTAVDIERLVVRLAGTIFAGAVPESEERCVTWAMRSVETRSSFRPRVPT